MMIEPKIVKARTLEGVEEEIETEGKEEEMILRLLIIP